MALEDLQQTMQELVAPLGVKIVSLSWTEFKGQKVLELLIDHPDGVDVDLCARVSDLLVATVDRYMVETENFYFEVASKGAEPPIRTLAELAEAIGSWVHIELEKPIAGIRVYEGTLVHATVDHVKLEYKDKTQQKTLDTTWDNIKSARYAVKL